MAVTSLSHPPLAVTERKSEVVAMTQTETRPSTNWFSQAATGSGHPLNVLHFVGHLSRWGLHWMQYCRPTHTTHINLLLLGVQMIRIWD